jgi:hypothetical protein
MGSRNSWTTQADTVDVVSKASMALLLPTFMLSLGSAAPHDDDLPLTIARVESADAKPTDPEFAISVESRRSSTSWQSSP